MHSCYFTSSSTFCIASGIDRTSTSSILLLRTNCFGSSLFFSSFATIPSSSTSFSSSSFSSTSSTTNGFRLDSLFARATVLATLLHSRLSLPLLYPLNERAICSPLQVPSVAGAKWDKIALAQGLGYVTPCVVAMTRLTGLLKAAHALSNYSGGRMRRTHRAAMAAAVQQRSRLKSLGRGSRYQAGRVNKDLLHLKPTHNDVDGRNRRAIWSAGRMARGVTKQHFLRQQYWRMLQPGNELKTRHLCWR